MGSVCVMLNSILIILELYSDVQGYGGWSILGYGIWCGLYVSMWFSFHATFSGFERVV